MVLHLIMTLFSEIVGEMLHKVPTIRMPVWLNKCSDGVEMHGTARISIATKAKSLQNG